MVTAEKSLITYVVLTFATAHHSELDKISMSRRKFIKRKLVRCAIHRSDQMVIEVMLAMMSTLKRFSVR